ncbi:hypothetical protein QQF64_021478 [Cirrhinus molitorella]|uniref:Uncharacterized protein n=1 Tax=Cirrhinus molitorella TaxID=172907 RepID=A0ABR3L767_9TELE
MRILSDRDTFIFQHRSGLQRDAESVCCKSPDDTDHVCVSHQCQQTHTDPESLNSPGKQSDVNKRKRWILQLKENNSRPENLHFYL